MASGPTLAAVAYNNLRVRNLLVALFVFQLIPHLGRDYRLVISRAWQNGLRAAHFGDTVLQVPKKKSPKTTNWPIIQEDSRKIIRYIIPHF